jgi:hypothetical protein
MITKEKGLWIVRDKDGEWQFETFKEAEDKKYQINSEKLKEMSK